MENHKGIERQALQEIDIAFNTLKKEFKGVRIDKILFSNSMKLNRIASVTIDGNLKITLKLNKNMLSTISDIRILENNPIKSISPKEKLIDYLRHEFVHIKEYQIAIEKNTSNGIIDVEKALDEIKQSKYATEIIDEALNSCGLQRNYDIINYKISEYACLNDSEAIAEGYSNIEEDNELCNAIKRTLKKKWGVNL